MKSFFKKKRRAEKRRITMETVYGLLATLLVASLYLSGIFWWLELYSFDWMLGLAGGCPASQEVVIVEIDEETLDTIGKWPLPRETYARLIDILVEAGVKAVGLNIIFPEESSEKSDRQLAEAIERARVVYLPIFFESATGLPPFTRLMGNYPTIAQFARGEGHINVVRDDDGTVRRALPYIKFEEDYYPQLGLLAATDAAGFQEGKTEMVPGEFVQFMTKDDRPVKIPLGIDNTMFIDWVGKWREHFKHHSLANIVSAYRKMKENGAPNAIITSLKDKICLVGLTVPGTYDERISPFEANVPSIAIHANIISQILENCFITGSRTKLNLALIVLLGVFSSLIFPKLKPSWTIATALGICAAYVALAITIFSFLRFWITVIHPLSAVIIPYIVMSLHHEIVISLERTRLERLATRDSLTDLFVIGHVRLLLQAEIKESKRSGQNLSVIMLDIDHFKSINDTYGHQTGDRVLIDVAKIFRATCRELDILGRYGGEEFIILLPDTNLTEGHAAAERIRINIMKHRFATEKGPLKITISAGAAQFAPEEPPDDLVKRADQALYHSKTSGRNRVSDAPEPAGQEEAASQQEG